MATKHIEELNRAIGDFTDTIANDLNTFTAKIGKMLSEIQAEPEPVKARTRGEEVAEEMCFAERHDRVVVSNPDAGITRTLIVSYGTPTDNQDVVRTIIAAAIDAEIERAKAEEREACAAMCDEMPDGCGGKVVNRRVFAAAIRSRTPKKENP